jgi:hypothetical protein
MVFGSSIVAFKRGLIFDVVRRSHGDNEAGARLDAERGGSTPRRRRSRANGRARAIPRIWHGLSASRIASFMFHNARRRAQIGIAGT